MLRSFVVFCIVERDDDLRNCLSRLLSIQPIICSMSVMQWCNTPYVDVQVNCLDVL